MRWFERCQWTSRAFEWLHVWSTTWSVSSQRSLLKLHTLTSSSKVDRLGVWGMRDMHIGVHARLSGICWKGRWLYVLAVFGCPGSLTSRCQIFCFFRWDVAHLPNLRRGTHKSRCMGDVKLWMSASLWDVRRLQEVRRATESWEGWKTKDTERVLECSLCVKKREGWHGN